MEMPSHEPPSKADFAIIIASVVVPIIALLWAMQPGNPYGYYVFLRVVVCGEAFVFFSIFAGEKREFLVMLFLGIAILYNPFFPVHLSREKWLVFDVATIIAFIVGFVLWVGGVRKRARLK